MNISSEYTFPIFISSTDYNLTDLRAELSRFLIELGYRAILSSAEGFPDSSPNLEPWESCLPVLDNCFVMILIIDGKYGSLFEWPNFTSILMNRKVSPTHAEYLYTHKKRKRMLVFIRKELMSYYQIYRLAKKKNGIDSLKDILPPHISFETLEFIHEVKTSKPIPWIKEFEDVTVIKKEVQKKMLNELAELFMVRNKYIEIIVSAFDNAMDELSPEKRLEIMEKINATRELTETKTRLEMEKEEYIKLNKDLEQSAKIDRSEKEKFEQKVKNSEEKIKSLEKIILFYEENKTVYLNQDGKIRLSDNIVNLDLNSSGTYISNLGTAFEMNNSGIALTNLTSPISLTNYGANFISKTCDSCGESKQQNYLSAIVDFNECPKCKRLLCNKCWPKNTLIIGTTTEFCYNCSTTNIVRKS